MAFVFTLMAKIGLPKLLGNHDHLHFELLHHAVATSIRPSFADSCLLQSETTCGQVPKLMLDYASPALTTVIICSVHCPL